MGRLGSIILAVVLSAAMAGDVLGGDLIVVSSNVSSVRPGQVVLNGVRVELPAGARVVLVAEDGRVVALDGPYAGAPSGAAGGDGGRGLLNALANLFSREGRETSTVGAMRSVPRGGPADPWVVDVTRSGNHCLMAAGPHLFWRPNANRRSSLGLKRESGVAAVMEWATGEATLAWPSGVPLEAGAAYLARLRERTTEARLVVHLVPDGLPSDVHRAAWMAEKGCGPQAIALLASLG